MAVKLACPNRNFIASNCSGCLQLKPPKCSEQLSRNLIRRGPNTTPMALVLVGLELCTDSHIPTETSDVVKVSNAASLYIGGQVISQLHTHISGNTPVSTRSSRMQRNDQVLQLVHPDRPHDQT